MLEKVLSTTARTQYLQDAADGESIIGSGLPPTLGRWQLRSDQCPPVISQFLLYHSTPPVPFGPEHNQFQ